MTITGNHIGKIFLLGTICFLPIVGTTANSAAVSGDHRLHLANLDFEDGDRGWTLPAGFRVVPRKGHNATSGLFCERRDPQKYDLATMAFPVQPGFRYRIGACIRTEELTGATAEKDSGAMVSLEFYRGDKWLGGIYPPGIRGTADWTTVEEMTGVAPPEADTGRIRLYIFPKMTGQAWFDEVKCELLKPSVLAYLAYPRYNTISAADGRLTLKLYAEGVEKKVLDTARCTATLTQNKFVREKIFPVSNGLVHAAFGEVPKGQGTLTVTVTTADGAVLGKEQRIELTLVPANRAIPPNACMLDEKGRAIVNGKPFLPIGLYVNDLHAETIDRLANSPFNCAIPYASLQLCLNDADEPVTAQSTLDVFDRCQQKNLKILFALHNVNAATEEEKKRWPDRFTEEAKEWLGLTDPRAITEKAVTLLRGHPALLAWYTCDEFRDGMQGILIHKRQLINRLDPFHPTWTVFNSVDNLPTFAAGCDVIGTDPYPIRSRDTRDMKLVERELEYAGATGIPHWEVPQIFNWGWYLAKDDPTLFQKEFRDPTEEEMRTMPIYMAIKGSTGFIFYSYFDYFKPQAASRQAFEKYWPKVCAIGTMLQGLAPFLLADGTEPAVQLQVINGNVAARAFMDEHKKIRVLIAGVGPGESRAIIRIKTAVGLTSQYAHTTTVGAGKYFFVGQDICSDVLAGE